jgi:hypothetical protein
VQIYKTKMNVKLQLKFTVDQAVGNQRYNSTLSLVSALDGRDSTPSPGRFTPGRETRYPFIVGKVGLRVGLDRCGKSRIPPEFNPLTIQGVASLYRY